MDQFSPFAIPQSPALGSMPPPSFAPPSLPPPLTNERPNETPPHHSQHGSGGTGHTSGLHHSDFKPGMASLSNPSLNPPLSFSASMLALPTPFAQTPGTPMTLSGVSTAVDSHLQPTLQYFILFLL